MGLQSLERRLERMVEGVFRGSRTAIRPIELGRRLVREMDDHRSVDVKGRRVVPNDFQIHLSRRDLASFDDIEDVLRTELVEAAREYAREEGYHFMGPVAVELVADDELQARPLHVVADAAPGRRRRRRRIARAAVRPAHRARRPAGHRRAPDRLHDPAQRPERQPPPRRDRAQPRRLRRADLGSTNGTMVNGTRISGEQRLNDGDIISFGSTYVRFEAS